MTLKNPRSKLIFFNFKIIAGKKVATRKDKNNKDWATKGEKYSLGKNTPTSRLLEKSGNGNIKNPATKPIIIAK